MTTAVMISELIPLHDDALIADIDAAFDEIDREIEEARAAEHDRQSLLLEVEWLVDELLEDTIRVSKEALEISVRVDAEDGHEDVAEVA